jgi:hypothetical protein
MLKLSLMSRTRWFLIGFVSAMAVGLSLRYLSQVLNPNLCSGRTLTAMLVPMVMGPGGIFMFSRGVLAKKDFAFAGIGVIAASIPLLIFSLLTITELKLAGCAPAPPPPAAALKAAAQ